MNKELQDILKSTEHIENIQQNFDTYQNNYFISRSSDFFCLELNGEAGELANLEKKVLKGKQIPLENIADEAADVFIALLNYCNSRGINLAKATHTKLIRIEEKRVELEEKGESY
jgi:NTP pyrophosphatase (non-canonical NTP hydrolase)